MFLLSSQLNMLNPIPAAKAFKIKSVIIKQYPKIPTNAREV